jgi:hypothetical protein
MLKVYLFVFGVGLIGVAMYLLLMFREVPGAAEERFGKLEALPDDVGKWKVDETSDEAGRAREQGLVREERLWFDANAGAFGRGRLFRQVRYRNAETQGIERVEPDQPVKRRRRRA